MTEEEKKKKKVEITKKRLENRKSRNTKCALAWAREDPELAKFLKLAPSNLDLSSPSTDKEIALFAAAEALWFKHELLGIVIPKAIKATWNNIPFRAKCVGFMECRKLKIPWNIDEYNAKAAARLTKLRAKGSALCVSFLIYWHVNTRCNIRLQVQPGGSAKTPRTQWLLVKPLSTCGRTSVVFPSSMLLHVL